MFLTELLNKAEGMNLNFDPKKYKNQTEKFDTKVKAKVYNSLETIKQSKIIEEK